MTQTNDEYSEEMPLLVRPSQLPDSPTLSQKHDNTVQQLILAKQQISKLEKENLSDIRSEQCVEFREA